MTVRFFLDENIPNSTVDMLEGLGYEIEHARTAGFHGCSDEEIAKYAKEQKAILVSRDLDFGNVLLYPRGSHHGMIVIRFPHDFTGKQITKNFKDFLKKIDVEDLVDHMIILELGQYRIRKV